MDIKVNSIGFRGKKEVLYGLKKAAERAKNIEYYNQPSIVSRMNSGAQSYTTAQKGAMQAYLDMALHDEAFEKTIQEMNISEFYSLQALLQPEVTEHSCVRPFNKFKQVITETLNDFHGNKKASVKASVEKLLKDLHL